MTKEQIESLGVTYVEGMTVDEVIAKVTENANALKKASDEKIAELDSKVKSHKAQIDKYSSEIASFKKKEQDNLTEEEKKQAHYAELEEDLAKAKRKIAVTDKVNTYMGIGYSKELAEKVAEAELDGKDVTKYHQEFIKAHDAEVEAKLMKNNPSLKGGGGNGGNDKFTRENFKKGVLSLDEVSALKDTNPALYKQILGITE